MNYERQTTCVEITDAKRIEMKSGLTEPGEHRNSGFIISACILIGLGVGLLVDHLGSGFLIGLGLGFVGSELLPLVRKSPGGECPQMGGANVTTLPYRSLPDLHRDRYCLCAGRNLAVCHCRIFNPLRRMDPGPGILYVVKVGSV